MSRAEKAVFWGGLAIILVYPLVFLLAEAQWFLLLVYILSGVGGAMTLKFHMCSRCMNFACPLNGVDDDVRRDFFERNPSVAEAWNMGGGGR